MPKKDSATVTNSVSALNARTHFGEILERIGRANERFLVYRKGEAAAIILGVEDFLQNVVNEPEIFRKAHLKAKKSGLDKLTLKDIDREVASVRSGTPKRPR